MTRHEFNQIYPSVNSFCEKFQSEIRSHRLKSLGDGHRHRNRSCRMTDAQMITLLIGFHMSSYRCFKHYYIKMVQEHKELFPGLLSYNRFVEIQSRVIIPFMMFLHYCCTGKCTGISFIDSTALKVCHNRRIQSHKVFKGKAARGKTSVDWFFGYKLHLIINDKGEIIAFHVTCGNIHDANIKVMQSLTKNLFGKLYGDKGYINQSLSKTLNEKGIELITKLRKKMKQKLLSEVDNVNSG